MISRIAGIDLGRWKHQVVIQHGATVEEIAVAQNVHDLVSAAERIAGESPEDTIVLLEDPNNALADLCVAAGCRVYLISPRRLHHWRKFKLLAAQKDDSTDARLLVEAYLADPSPFNEFIRLPGDVSELYSLSLLRHRHRRDRVRLVQRLQAALVRYYPLPLTLDTTLKSQWIAAFIQAAPTPAAAQALTEHQLGRLLSPQKRYTVDEVREMIEQPPLPCHPSVVRGLVTQVTATTESLIDIDRQERALQKDILKAADALSGKAGRDWEILTSIPGVGGISAATAYSHGYIALAKRNFPAFRAMAGIAPVTERSGTSLNKIRMRTMCNRRLRDACYHLSYASIVHSPFMREVYDVCREKRKQKHSRALRTVSHAQWVRIFGMLRTDTLFDPAKW